MGPRELVLADRYDMHRVCGNMHDAVAVERSGLRPADVKTTTPTHHGRRDGAYVLRARQHSVLMATSDYLQRDHGFQSTGDYVVAVCESIGDLLIILDDARTSARDLDRHANPSFYDRDGGDKQREASVEWADVPGITADEMHARLDAAPTYLRALGEDPDMYADELARVRDRVREAGGDTAESDGRDAPTRETAQAP